MIDDSTDKLKPCQFCGGKPYRVKVGNNYTKSQGYDLGCKKCRYKISDRVIKCSSDCLIKYQNENWNKRHVNKLNNAALAIKNLIREEGGTSGICLRIHEMLKMYGIIDDEG